MITSWAQTVYTTEIDDKGDAMKLILGVLLGIALSIITNLVSGFISPKAERHKRLVWSLFAGLVVIAVVVLFLPDTALPFLKKQTPVRIVANQKMVTGASLSHRAVCRIDLSISNVGDEDTVVEEIAALVYVGDELLPFDTHSLGGESGSVSYRVLFWDSEPFVEPADILKTPTWPFQSTVAFPFALEAKATAHITVDIILDAPTTPWVFRGMRYPFATYQEPKLPDKDHIAVGFSISEPSSQPVVTRLRSCSVIEAPTSR